MEQIKGFEIVERFLDDWKEESTKWYNEQLIKYKEAKEERNNNPSEARKLYDSNASDEELEPLLSEYFEKDERGFWLVPRFCGYGFKSERSHNALVHILNEEHEEFSGYWKHITKHIGKKISYSESVEQMLQKEYERKYKKLVSDVQKITGDVQDANLHIGKTRNIEGFISGSNGKAELWTTLVIGEIQAPHFRFYCHKR